MTIKLDNYHLGNKILSFARDLSTATCLQQQGLSYVFLNDNSLYFFPDNVTITLKQETVSQLLKCDNYDIFQIDLLGFMHRCFISSSADNGFMLTAHCNSNCIMCPASDFQRKNNSCLTINDYIEITEHIPLDTHHITITGGEPFLVGVDIFRLLLCLKNRLPYTNYLLLTNGRALGHFKFCQMLIDTLPPKTIIAIPLHGYNADTHDFITRSPGGYAQTIAGIRNLLFGNSTVEIRIVVSNLNCNYITRIAELIISEFPNVYRVVFMGLEMLGNAVKNNVWISYSDAFSRIQKAIDLLTEYGIPVLLYNFPLCAVEKEYHLLVRKSISDYKVKFLPICDECRLKDACGGLFSSSIRYASKDISIMV